MDASEAWARYAGDQDPNEWLAHDGPIESQRIADEYLIGNDAPYPIEDPEERMRVAELLNNYIGAEPIKDEQTIRTILSAYHVHDASVYRNPLTDGEWVVDQQPCYTYEDVEILADQHHREDLTDIRLAEGEDEDGIVRSG